MRLKGNSMKPQGGPGDYPISTLPREATSRSFALDDVIKNFSWRWQHSHNNLISSKPHSVSQHQHQPEIQSNKMSTFRFQPTTTCAISSTIKHLGFNRRFPHSNCAVFRRRRNFTIMAASIDPLEICVKASVTTPNKLGDCKIFFSCP